MNFILNFTQHEASADQHAAGVMDLVPGMRADLQDLLTFRSAPSANEVLDRAARLRGLAMDCVGRQNGQGQMVMIGGAPFLMSALEAELQRSGFTPVYAFSERVSVDQPQPDGTVRKVAVFKHSGWVTVHSVFYLDRP